MIHLLRSSCLVGVILTLHIGFTAGQEKKESVFEGKPINEWAKQLQSPEAEKRLQAVQVFWDIALDSKARTNPEVKQAIPALIGALKDSDYRMRNAAARVLGYLGEDARAAVPALIVALKDKDQYVRFSAMAALGGIGPEAKEAIPELVKLLRFTPLRELTPSNTDLEKTDVLELRMRLEHESISKEAAIALAQIGLPAVPALLDCLMHTDANLRLGAARTLGWMGPKARLAVPKLTEILADKLPEVRGQAAFALGQIGPEARQSMPALLDLLKDKDALVRVHAADAVWQIEKNIAALPVLEKTLKEIDDQDTLILAIKTLGKVGTPGVQALIGVIKKGNPEKIEAFNALAHLGPEARDAIPVLSEVLQTERLDRYVWVQAGYALRMIGPPTKDCVPVLIERLREDKEIEVRRVSASLLGKVGKDAKDSIPTLLEALKDTDTNLRFYSAEALRKIDPEAAKKAGLK